MPKTSNVCIELTDEQKEKLLPLFGEVMRADQKGKPVILLAQIHIVFNDAVASCKIVNHKTSLKVQAAFGKKHVGKSTTYNHVVKCLMKARGLKNA